MEVSPDLKDKLEKAFQAFKENRLGEMVIAELVNQEEELSLYLIAKDNASDRYYGIIESALNGPVPIFGISETGIEALDLIEVPMIPFKANRYLEYGTKTS